MFSEGGEKSRLITQILTDENRDDVVENIATPNIQAITHSQKIIHKSKGLIDLLNNYAVNGFSPSSLSNYIRNPIDFYKQNLLGIQYTEEVEENIAANTMGTIIHDSLEELYTPFIDKEIDRNQLIESKKSIQSIVHKNFKKTYLDGAYESGKNLIAYNVVIRYIENFLG
ncbi:PD-(D/E)XK nuclease family protein [Maribacter litopenaei]|uniref:PD-(D/E)XK nuclease family protein n=1 Tax=Maribacter litopenaei TaxID=2976127 RepID=A0ABY5Y730_9FLAO|nr:PD-(D/E)XK nuclease family protein [Maribacter litopenaei]UWX54838.1 PD-(D/E)XK nuclease family protein [Maribacter litopenaei]